MKYLLTSFTAFVFFFGSLNALSAQNKDSVEGDFEALQALYNSTQGNGVEMLSSANDLPAPENAEYPFMFIINDEIYALSKERRRGVGKWVNHGPIWKDKTGWENMTPQTMGNAVGVTTDAAGRVTILDMQKVVTEPVGDGGFFSIGNGLVGTLPIEIGNLKKLKWFNVKQNFFHGEIPDVFEGWTDLERWSVGGQHWEINLDRRILWHESDHRKANYDNNPFTTSSPKLGKKIVSTNNFRSKLPSSLDGLPNLELIEAAYQYIEGPLPNWSDLPSILGIYIPNIMGPESKTLGTIPESWGSLTNMQLFNLVNYQTHSRFSGQLPDGMKNWSNLANFAISGNDFGGAFPEFKVFNDLVYLAIGGMEFTGEFPWNSIFNGNNSRLSKFSIGGNNFTGSLPTSIPDATFPDSSYPNYRLADFGIANNNFSGDFPDWPTRFRGLQIVDISRNNFTGPFPEGFMDQQNLKAFRIQHNNFSGSLPDRGWGERKIDWFYINNNNFEGEIPNEWQTLFQNPDGSWRESEYSRVLFNNNNFSGKLPDWGKNVPWDNFQNYFFHENRYTFKDVASVYDELKSVFGNNFKVNDQKPFGNTMSRTMPEGDSLVIDMSEYHYDGNEYKWIKGDEPVQGQNSAILTIQDLNIDDEGIYYLEVKNRSFPELGTQISQQITFELGADDGLNGGKDENNSNGTDGDPTGAVYFPSPPSVYGPLDNSENIPLKPEFRWNDIGADYYVLHVSRRNPSGMVVDVIVEETSYLPKEIMDSGIVHDWRVRGVKDGEMGEWSPIFSFTTQEDGLPQVAGLIAPAQFTEDVQLRPELVWEDVAGDLYQVRLKKSETGDWLINAEVADTSYSMTEDLEPETAYKWQVKSVKDGVDGAWGPQWEFSTGIFDYSVAAPSLVAPGQGIEYDNLIPTFEWESVDADKYNIVVLQDTTTNAKVTSGMAGESAVINDETNEPVYTPSNPLKPEAVYFWQVQAVVDGVEGEWSEIWEFKTPEEQQTVSIRPEEQPAATSLDQNYPNPFNPTTQIEFTLSEMQEVSIRVYDMAGRQVATLVEGLKQAGRHSATFDASSLSSGIYIYRFMSDSHQFSRKMTLIK